MLLDNEIELGILNEIRKIHCGCSRDRQRLQQDKYLQHFRMTYLTMTLNHYHMCFLFTVAPRLN